MNGSITMTGLPMKIFVIVFGFGIQFLQNRTASAVWTPIFTPISVRYVTSNNFGNMIGALGVSVITANTSKTFSQKTLCECRTMCFVQGNRCHGFSFVTQEQDDNVGNCHLTDKQTRVLIYEVNSNAIHVYKEALLPTMLAQMMSDSHLYIILRYKWKVLYSKYGCARVPGFQQAVFKTEAELKVLLQLSKMKGVDLAIGLIKEHGQLKWTDGTHLDATFPLGQLGIEIRSNLTDDRTYHVFSTDGYLYDVNYISRYYIVCQARNLIFN